MAIPDNGIMLIHCVFRQQSMLLFFWNPNILLLCNFGNPVLGMAFQMLDGKIWHFNKEP